MGQREQAADFRPFQFSVAWLLAYLAAMALVIAGLTIGRSQLLKTYGTVEAKAEWDAWRQDAKEMAEGAGPVKRREPKSLEPPALVLMRDHFAACLGLALLLSTVLFGTFMFFLRGALHSSPALRAGLNAPRE
jgi:hypothetical protein